MPIPFEFLIKPIEYVLDHNKKSESAKLASDLSLYAFAKYTYQIAFENKQMQSAKDIAREVLNLTRKHDLHTVYQFTIFYKQENLKKNNHTNNVIKAIQENRDYLKLIAKGQADTVSVDDFLRQMNQGFENIKNKIFSD